MIKVKRTAVMAVVALVLACAAASWSAFERSLIPRSLSGRVEAISVASGTSGREWNLRVGADSIQVDERVVHQVEVGDRVEKDRWSWSMKVNRSSVGLAPSAEPFQFVILAVVAVGVVLGAAWLHRGREETSCV